MRFDTVCVVGLGYIGLPTAAMFASGGMRVIGAEVSDRIVSTLKKGDVHIEEPGLGEIVRDVVSSGDFIPQLEPAEADAFIIAVPTPNQEDHSADLSFVYSAAESIVPYLRKGNLVVLESTSPPGTTASLVPILERSGLHVGPDILLAHSPERVLPGRILAELVENDRVIGGYTREAAEASAALYRTFVRGDIHLTDATTAEMSKLMENTYRDVNIALANEFASIAERVGFDVHEAIALANHHPRVDILHPGPGVGGHCIAVDPWFIVQVAPEEALLIGTARRINDGQPSRVASIVEQETAGRDRPRVAVLGMTYKPDVDDVRESPAVAVATILQGRGFDLRLHDPLARNLPDGLQLTAGVDETVRDADLVLILTDHAAYHALQPLDPALQGVRRRVIVDTRNCIDVTAWRAAGWRVRQLGVAETAAVGGGRPQ